MQRVVACVRIGEPQLRESARLSEQQGMLADLVKNLTKPTEANPENDPDSLPETVEEDHSELIPSSTFGRN